MAHLVEHLKARKRPSPPDERKSKIHKRQYAEWRTQRATEARIRASNAGGRRRFRRLPVHGHGHPPRGTRQRHRANAIVAMCLERRRRQGGRPSPAATSRWTAT